MTKKQSGCFILEHCVHFASATPHAKCNKQQNPWNSWHQVVCIVQQST